MVKPVKRAVKKSTKPAATTSTQKKPVALKKKEVKKETSQPSLAAKMKQNLPKVRKAMVVIARAGTGKTTTAVGALKNLFSEKTLFGDSLLGYPPSDQQKDIFDTSRKLFAGVRRDKCAMLSFNRSIAEELQKKVPNGVTASTLHSMGNGIVRDSFGKLGRASDWRTSNIACEILGINYQDAEGETKGMLFGLSNLVSLCKNNLVDGSDREELCKMVAHYGIEITENFERCLELVHPVLERSKDVKKCGFIDYDDMIWLPVVLKLPCPKFDLAVIDEAQDLNRSQQELAKSISNNLMFIGDDRQAIYGFAGADCDSLPRLTAELNCPQLPLTMTFRCGKRIVEDAKAIVPDFEAHHTNREGMIRNLTMENYRSEVSDGDMLICRVNAPLVSQCLRFLKEGRKATIKGKSIGQGLVKTLKEVSRNCVSSVPDAIASLDEWYDRSREKENARKYPSDSRLMALADTRDCLSHFFMDANTVYESVGKIESIFSDKTTSGITLSTIHKVKGLEAENVFLLEPGKATVPHPMAKTPWQKVQEWNLRYVAITRTIDTLNYVKDAPGMIDDSYLDE